MTGPLRIVVADDEPDMRDYFQKGLPRLGHKVVGAAANGRELVELCRAQAPDLVITDFVALSNLTCPQRNLVDGDARCASVAAASIVAKVTRDRLMLDADRSFPEYGFVRHKGYATPEHLAALDRWGPCPLHRRTFAGVWRQGELFVLEKDD